MWTPPGRDTFANGRKKVVLQVVEVANQVVGTRLYGELAGFEIRDSPIQSQSGGALAE